MAAGGVLCPFVPLLCTFGGLLCGVRIEGTLPGYRVMDSALWSAYPIVRFWWVIAGRGGAGFFGVDVVCFVGVGGGGGDLGG